MAFIRFGEAVQRFSRDPVKNSGLWAKRAETAREKVEAHGLRRAAGMRGAAEMLAAAGRNPSLALAVADAQNRGALDEFYADSGNGRKALAKAGLKS